MHLKTTSLVFKLVSLSVELAFMPFAEKNAGSSKPVNTVPTVSFAFLERSDVHSHAVAPVINAHTMHFIFFKLPNVFSFLVF